MGNLSKSFSAGYALGMLCANRGLSERVAKTIVIAIEAFFVGLDELVKDEQRDG
jgi:hypothetical protein